MDPNSRLLMLGSGGAVTGPGLDVEDVFSTWLYTGTGSTQTITNGIDLSGEGGLVWLKNRSLSASHALIDTELGGSQHLRSNSTDGSGSSYSISFNIDGFGIGSSAQDVNESPRNYASWTFRKAPGFFDVVTYTGNGVAGRTVAHNLGSVPGCVIIKCTSNSDNWYVQHRSVPATQVLLLNATNAAYTTDKFYNTYASSTHITLPADASTNGSGRTYVAYLFAHDEQIFGESADQSVIKCGSYVGTGSNVLIDLGWEPQWLMVKRASATTGNASQDSWHIINNMTGITVTVNGNSPSVKANTSDAENVYGGWGSLDPQGFYTGADVLNSGQTFIYIAIRRGPMETPTSGTEVFNAQAETPSGASDYVLNATSGFPVDWIVSKQRGNAASGPFTTARLTNNYLQTSASSLEGTNAYEYDLMSGVGAAWDPSATVSYAFRRAPGFFDVVAYAGTGGSSAKTHNLTVAPELLIVKVRNANGSWYVYSSATGSQYLTLNTTNGATGAGTWSAPTSSEFTAFAGINDSNETYIAHLFATVPGVSKVGSYTGTGTTLNVDCGFTAGARFVLIKRTDSSGDWFVWDTARGIVAGNDSYLLLNSTAAEVTSTDYIDPLSSGFQISSSAPAAINANGGSFIFLAIA